MPVITVDYQINKSFQMNNSETPLINPKENGEVLNVQNTDIKI